jgi:hypothetical protein
MDLHGALIPLGRGPCHTSFSAPSLLFKAHCEYGALVHSHTEPTVRLNLVIRGLFGANMRCCIGERRD